MDSHDFDSNNPNIDGDLKALFKIRRKREKGSLAGILSTISGSQEETIEDKKVAKPELEILKEELLKASKENNVQSISQILTRLYVLSHDISSPDLRDVDNSTALHVAIRHRNKEVALYLINASKSDDYLMAEYDVTVRNASSKMTCLHLLAKSGDKELSEALLNKLINKKKRNEYLHRVTLVELDGQRPRDLSAIHIAALHGHTHIINLLWGMGISVNLLNSKEDTPVLWAVRGNHIGTVMRLIELKADVNRQNDKGSTPLHWAVRYGLGKMTKLLVDKGKANVNHMRKLGLVCPVVAAAALGYADILKTLLSNGADPNTRITSNQTALHMAAAYGNDDVIEVLEQYNVHCDAVDDAGSTPLHLAAKNGNTSTIRILCDNGASLESRDKLSKTVWDYAIESDGLDVLKVIVGVYRQKMRMVGRQLVLPSGTNPLHKAARRGDVEKIQHLIAEGADPHAKDEAENTLFHIAAHEDQSDVLRTFIDNGDINVPNEDGDIPIHIAARRGHYESVKVLIKKSKLDTTNENGYTPLHEACRSEEASAAVVGTLVDNIVANNNWSLIDATDSHGNTALHVAAIHNRSSIMPVLKSLNHSISNHNGDNPLHAAAKMGNADALKVMFEVFNKRGMGLNLDQDNKEGETILHICAKAGSHELIEELIEAGSDLTNKNEQGNTVLHEMAEEIVANPGRRDMLLSVYREITEFATVWWCIKFDLPRPDRTADIFEELQRKALLYLTSEVYNHAGYNVIGYCANIGALALFKEILATENVCKMPIVKQCTFDITNMTPDTNLKSSKRKRTPPSAKVGVITDDENDNKIKISPKSYLEIVTEMNDDVLATQFLDVTPMKQLSENIWAAYQWIYVLLMVIQITYMSCLSAYSIPAVGYLYNTTDPLDAETYSPTAFPFALFLIWPFILMMFQAMVTILSIRKYVSQKKVRKNGPESRSGRHCCRDCKFGTIPGKIIMGLFSNMAGITAVIFAICIMTWYALYVLDDRAQVYFLAIAMLLGWMLTIVFTKGFKSVHALSTMLSFIIIRDVTRFIVIYLFMLLGFAFAMHTLFRIPLPVATLYNSPWDTIFLTFNLMLGMADIFDEEFDQNYADAGSSSEWVKFFYLFYMILATIIMLNLLIAMLSDTYNDIKSKEGTTWRVTSVRLALRIERWMPFLKNMVLRMGLADMSLEYDEGSERWFMTVPKERLSHDAEHGEVTELSKSLHRLEAQMDMMHSVFEDMNDRIDAISYRMTAITSGGDGGGGGGGGGPDPGRPGSSSTPRRRSSAAVFRKRRNTRVSLH